MENKIIRIELILLVLLFLLSCSKESVNDVQSTDKTPPTITSITPTDGEKNVQPSYYPLILFSEVMDLATININNIYLTDQQGVKIPCRVTSDLMYNNSTRTTAATITPDRILNSGAVYRINISNRCADVSGNKLTSNIESNFTVTDNQAATLVEFKVIDEDELQLVFDKDIELSVIKNSYKTLNGNGLFFKFLGYADNNKNRLNLKLDYDVHFFVGDEISFTYSNYPYNLTTTTAMFTIPVNKWAFAVPRFKSWSNLMHLNGRFYVILDCKLYCFNEKGTLLWSSTLAIDNSIDNFSIFVKDNTVIVLMSGNSIDIEKFDITTGIEVYSKHISHNRLINVHFNLCGNYIVADYIDNSSIKGFIDIYDMNLNLVNSVDQNDNTVLPLISFFSGNVYLQSEADTKIYGILSVPDLKTPTVWLNGELGRGISVSSNGNFLLTDLGVFKLKSDKITLEKTWSNSYSYYKYTGFSPNGSIYAVDNNIAGSMYKLNNENQSVSWTTKMDTSTGYKSILSVASNDKIVVAMVGFNLEKILITFDPMTGNQINFK